MCSPTMTTSNVATDGKLRVEAHKPLGAAADARAQPLEPSDREAGEQRHASAELKKALLQNLNLRGGDELETLDTRRRPSSAPPQQPPPPLPPLLTPPLTPQNNVPRLDLGLPFDASNSLFATQQQHSPSPPPLQGIENALAPVALAHAAPSLAPFLAPPPPPALPLLSPSVPLLSLPAATAAAPQPVGNSPLRPDSSQFASTSFSPTTTTPSPEQIKLWRRRFYKAFKSVRSQFAHNNLASDSDEIASARGRRVNFPVERSGYTHRHESAVQSAPPPAPPPPPLPPSAPTPPARTSTTSRRPLASIDDETQPRPTDRVRLLAEFLPENTSPPLLTTPQPSRLQISNDFNGSLDADGNELEEPCPAVGCLTARNEWLLQNDATLDNTETCNSLRLKVLVESAMVADDAETSKRVIQQRAESELGTFFNVVCGTGFFSYVMHTDEFCLVSSTSGLTCYIHSPICADSLGVASELRRSRRHQQQPQSHARERRREAFINHN